MRHFPFATFIFIPTNNFKLRNFFRTKDLIPKELHSSIVYIYKCAGCNARYVGQTGLQLCIRIAKHKGFSFRTILPLYSPEFSSMCSPSHEKDHPITTNDFSILDSVTDSRDRKILESLYNHQLESLNSTLI